MRLSVYKRFAYNILDDKSRVCLTEAPGVKNSDYINASFIDVRVL